MINSKKGSALIFILLILIIAIVGIGVYIFFFSNSESEFLPVPEGVPNTLNCRDTDQSVIDKMGISVNKVDKKTDTCLNEKVLREYKCEYITGDITQYDYDCIAYGFSGCNEGKCVK